MNTEWLSNLVVSWLPFIILIVVWIMISRFSQRTSSGRSLVELYEQQIVETRQMNATLERIATALEKRST